MLQRLANQAAGDRRPPGSATPDEAIMALAALPADSRVEAQGTRAYQLPDQHDVDAAGQLLVDLENLSDEAVLAVGGDRAAVLGSTRLCW